MASTSNQAPAQETAQRHLLLIDPISTVSEEIDSQVATVAKITGQHQYTVRQKLVGGTFDILLIDSDLQTMRESCRQLQDAGFSAALVEDNTLRVRPRRVFVYALHGTESGALNFLGSNGETVGWIDSKLSCYITVGSLTPELYGVNRALLGQAIGNQSAEVNAVSERITAISREKPALILQLAGSPTLFLFESGRFNFNTLPGEADLSAAVNFQRLVDTLSNRARATVNTDFGLKTFPYGSLASKPDSVDETRRRFLLYSQIAFSGFTGGLQRSENLQAREASRAQEIAVESGGNKQAGRQLPPPPVAPHKSHNSAISGENPLSLQRLKAYGPPYVVAGLLGAIFVLATLISTGALNVHPALALLPLGLLGCVWSLTMTLRKRTIEQLPTSRIRSMPTGTVEICGEAERKYQLQAPCSLTNCVYYSYQVLRRQRYGVNEYGKPQERWVVVERGDSGRTPFYLKDETGKVMIDPQGAIIAAGESEEYTGDMYAIFSGTKSDGERRVIETVIPEGAKLYILGHARPQKNSASLKQRDYLDRLRALRADPEAIKAYDTDGDGEISYKEWEVARAEVEQKMLRESLAADNQQETVVVGDHPGSGLFYISGKGELEILRSYAWKIPLSAVIGFLILATAISSIIG